MNYCRETGNNDHCRPQDKLPPWHCHTFFLVCAAEAAGAHAQPPAGLLPRPLVLARDSTETTPGPLENVLVLVQGASIDNALQVQLKAGSIKSTFS